MALADFIHPLEGDVYRHIPDGSPYPVTDFRFAGRGADNRWNERDEPTLYLGCNAGLALAEFARHVERDYRLDLATQPLRRRMYRLYLQLNAVLDFCDPSAWVAAGSLPDAPSCFLNRTVARATARYIRVTTPAVAMRVPSVAFLDDLSRWSLVVFLDKLPSDPRSFVLGTTDIGVIHVGR